MAAGDLDHARLALELAERDLAAAEFAAHTAEHDVESARAALARVREGGDEPFQVTAPIAGRVFRVLQESAGVVAQGTPLLEVADPADLEIVVDVLTSDAVRIRPGAPVRIERWGGDAPLDGRVRLVEPSGYTKLSALGVEEQRTNVVIDLTSPPAVWQALGDGFRVDARIVVFRADDALKVPASALFRDGDGWAAFVVEHGRARKRPVVSPRRSAREALIESGARRGRDRDPLSDRRDRRRRAGDGARAGVSAVSGRCRRAAFRTWFPEFRKRGTESERSLQTDYLHRREFGPFAAGGGGRVPIGR